MKFTISAIALIVFALFAVPYLQAGQLNKVNHSYLSKKLLPDSTKLPETVKQEPENIGIGPIKELKLGPINSNLVKDGKSIFNSKCFACHRMDSKLVGPALDPIVKKVSSVYLMNYLLNTTEMQKKEPELKKLIKEYNGIVMPDQYLNKKQARAVLEYMRSTVKK